MPYHDEQNQYRSEAEPQTAPPNPDYLPRENSGLATASIILSVLSFVTFCMGASIIFAPLALLFGILSRGSQKKFGTNATIGICLSSVSLFLTLAALCVIYFTAFTFTSDYLHSETMIEKIEALENLDEQDSYEEYQDIYQDIYEDIYREIYQKFNLK